MTEEPYQYRLNKSEFTELKEEAVTMTVVHTVQRYDSNAYSSSGHWDLLVLASKVCFEAYKKWYIKKVGSASVKRAALLQANRKID